MERLVCGRGLTLDKSMLMMSMPNTAPMTARKLSGGPQRSTQPIHHLENTSIHPCYTASITCLHQPHSNSSNCIQGLVGRQQAVGSLVSSYNLIFQQALQTICSSSPWQIKYKKQSKAEEA